MHPAKAYAGRHVEPGRIDLYSGPASGIPMGWALCDGTGDTPDLTDRFVVGAGSTYNPDDTGGAATDSITLAEANLPAHTHGSAGAHTHSVYKVADQSGTGAANWTLTTVTDFANPTGSNGAHTHTSVGSGTAFSVATLPPYYALAYIMKL